MGYTFNRVGGGGKGVYANIYVKGIPKSTLPSDYTELDYIEFDGSQYIKTGVQSTAIDKLCYKFNPSYVNSDIHIACNTRSASSGSYRTYLTILNGKFYCEWNNTTYYDNPFGTCTANTLYEVESYIGNNSQYLKVNGATLKTGSEVMHTTSVETIIGGWNGNGSLSAQYKGKLYTITAYKDDAIVFNYVPCKNASGEVGFYDTVSKTFKGKTTGNALVAGPTSTSQAGLVTALNPSGNIITAKWVTTATYSSGVWAFQELDEYGDYLVVATDGSKAASGIVDVIEPTDYELELKFGVSDIYLYNCDNGSIDANRCKDVTGDYHICYGWNYLGSIGYMNETASYTDIGDVNNNYAGILIQTNNKIDVTDYKYLCIEGYVVSHSTGSYNYGYAVHLDANHITSLHNDRGTPSGGGNPDPINSDTRTVTKIDISSITGSYYIGWECSCSAYGSHTTTSRIYKVWLEAGSSSAGYDLLHNSTWTAGALRYYSYSGNSSWGALRPYSIKTWYTSNPAAWYGTKLVSNKQNVTGYTKCKVTFTVNATIGSYYYAGVCINIGFTSADRSDMQTPISWVNYLYNVLRTNDGGDNPDTRAQVQDTFSNGTKTVTFDITDMTDVYFYTEVYGRADDSIELEITAIELS